MHIYKSGPVAQVEKQTGTFTIQLQSINKKNNLGTEVKYMKLGDYCLIHPHEMHNRNGQHEKSFNIAKINTCSLLQVP